VLRNDPAQYDELVDQWWDPAGAFAMLHWLAAARAGHVPPAPSLGALLVDLACGGGLMAPHVARLGYRHVGVDLGLAGLQVARAHGVAVVGGSVLAVPLADGCADVVLAGEVLEHVADHAQVLRECARLLRPGGTLVVDAIAATRLADLVAVRIAERLPGGPPPGLHDPALFVDRAALTTTAEELGIDLRLTGLRPSVRDVLRWLSDSSRAVRMRPMRYSGVLFAGHGRKR
jgi:2-polyprenyl-6-hydroxyphenyl methylase/3-demethylubiquinone-9 3-methyltransferase